MTNHVLLENIYIMKSSADKSVEECTENIDEVKTAGMDLFEHRNGCVCSYTICVALTVMIFTISIDMNMSIKQQIININGKCQIN